MNHIQILSENHPGAERVAECFISLVSRLLSLHDSLFVNNPCTKELENEDGTPCLDMTLGTDKKLSDWGIQSGDNSFTGNAYGFPLWGVGTLTMCEDWKNKEAVENHVRELAFDLIDDAMNQSDH